MVSICLIASCKYKKHAIFLSCFGDFSDFSYFLPGLFRLLGWVWGAVLVISAVSATFCEASGIMVEAQHHKLTTTY